MNEIYTILVRNSDIQKKGQFKWHIDDLVDFFIDMIER